MEILGFFGKIVKIIDRYGWWKVLQSIFLAALFLFVIYYIPMATKSVVQKTTIESLNELNRINEENHLKQLEKRRELQPRIEAILRTFLNNTNADRAFVIELHNGSNNINGIPFLHGSVTYDVAVEGMDMIDEDYQNLSLSRFEMATYLHKNFEFIGTIEEMGKIDPKLAAKLTADGAKYIAITTLFDGTNEWGWFGILYDRTTDIPSDKILLNNMVISSQAIVKEMDVLKRQNNE